MESNLLMALSLVDCCAVLIYQINCPREQLEVHIKYQAFQFFLPSFSLMAQQARKQAAMVNQKLVANH